MTAALNGRLVSYQTRAARCAAARAAPLPSSMAPATSGVSWQLRLRKAAAPLHSAQVRGFFASVQQWFSAGAPPPPPMTDIENGGADLGKAIPRPDLVLREGMERGTPEWTQQLYGAALYWHLASTNGQYEENGDLYKGLDILEVGCSRGGGARYLAQVARPRSYTAADLVPANVEEARRRNDLAISESSCPVRFEIADARALDATFEHGSFDVILSVELVHAMADKDGFLRYLVGAQRLLRHGGAVHMCELLQKDQIEAMHEVAPLLGMEIEAEVDLSKKVHQVGRLSVGGNGEKYLRVVLRKSSEPTPLRDPSDSSPPASDAP